MQPWRDIFKYSIKAGDFVKVDEEINIAKRYLQILDIRFEGRFKWNVDIAEELLECRSIKMIFQPLVENAAYHGLEKTYNEGYIIIKGWREQDSMIFEIRDNGIGFEPVKLEAMRKVLANKELLEAESRTRQRIGIANIQWRIKLMLGDQYGLSVTSDEGKETIVRLSLPYENRY